MNQSSSSSNSSSSSSGSKKRKKKDAINERLQQRLAEREREENAWNGWICPCGAKNFQMKGICYACFTLKPLSAATRVAQAKVDLEASRVRARSSPSRSRGQRQKRKPRSPSTSSSSRTRSSRSRDRKRTDIRVGNDSAETTSAKRIAMERFEEIVKLSSSDERKRAFRKLLREWHPDKCEADADAKIATAVFQFLQQGAKAFKL